MNDDTILNPWFPLRFAAIPDVTSVGACFGVHQDTSGRYQDDLPFSAMDFADHGSSPVLLLVGTSSAMDIIQFIVIALTCCRSSTPYIGMSIHDIGATDRSIGNLRLLSGTVRSTDDLVACWTLL